MTRGALSAMAGVLLAGALSSAMADHNTPPIVSRAAFTVVGWEARTTNAREMSAEGQIPKLWARVRKENALAKIHDRIGNEVIALYTDYEGDKDGAYTYVLGALVGPDAAVPEGMTRKSVPAGRYTFLNASGKLAPDAVVRLWQQMWALEASHAIARAYQTDYEIHHLESSGESAVELYVGVKH